MPNVKANGLCMLITAISSKHSKNSKLSLITYRRYRGSSETLMLFVSRPKPQAHANTEGGGNGIG